MIFKRRVGRQTGFLQQSCCNSATRHVTAQLGLRSPALLQRRGWRGWGAWFPQGSSPCRGGRLCQADHVSAMCPTDTHPASARPLRLFWHYFLPDFCPLPMRPQHGKAKNMWILPSYKSTLQPKVLSLPSEYVTSMPFCGSTDNNLWRSISRAAESLLWIHWKPFWRVLFTQWKKKDIRIIMDYYSPLKIQFLNYIPKLCTILATFRKKEVKEALNITILVSPFLPCFSNAVIYCFSDIEVY